MKRFLKYTIIVCVLTLSLLPICPVSAYDESKTTTVRSMLQSGELELSEVAGITPYSLDDVLAASVSLYASSVGPASSTNYGGHAWIVIRNYDYSRLYGNASVSANNTISLGTFGNTTPTGLWYNIERYKKSLLVSSDVKYVKTYILASEHSYFNSVIVSSRAWTYDKNCSTFARKVWNAAGSTQIAAAFLETPSTLKSKIAAISGSMTGTSDADFTSTTQSNTWAY